MDNYYGDSMIEDLGTSYVAMDDHIEVSNGFVNNITLSYIHGMCLACIS